MFSPMSVGAFIYKSLVGPTGEEDGDMEADGGDNARGEDSTEKDSSGSDSDGGTSTDPPGLRVAVERTQEDNETDIPQVETEIITSDLAAEEFSARHDEFAAKLAALPGAESTGDDQIATTDVVVDDGGGASNDLDAAVISSPEDIQTVCSPTVESEHSPEDENGPAADYEPPQLDFARHENLQAETYLGDPFRDKHADAVREPVEFEQGELQLDSDSDSDDYSSTTSDETMSTVRENTESCQLEPDDHDELEEADDFNKENDDLIPYREEDRMYIAPDLELPFYKTTVRIEETINVAEALENMDSKRGVEPPQPEAKYVPRPITDEELENALQILRSGRPPPKRSWYSLDNISTSKPNRAFALYYTKAEKRHERRNSAGDELDEPYDPQENGIALGLTVKDTQPKSLHYPLDLNPESPADSTPLPPLESVSEFTVTVSDPTPPSEFVPSLTPGWVQPPAPETAPESPQTSTHESFPESAAPLETTEFHFYKTLDRPPPLSTSDDAANMLDDQVKDEVNSAFSLPTYEHGRNGDLYIPSTPSDDELPLPGPEYAPPPIAPGGLSKPTPHSLTESSPKSPADSDPISLSVSIPGSTPDQALPSPPEMPPKMVPEYLQGSSQESSTESAPIDTEEHPAQETPDDSPPSPAAADNANVPNSLSTEEQLKDDNLYIPSAPWDDESASQGLECTPETSPQLPLEFDSKFPAESNFTPPSGSVEGLIPVVPEPSAPEKAPQSLQEPAHKYIPESAPLCTIEHHNDEGVSSATNDDAGFQKDQFTDEANDIKPSPEPRDSPISPEPYISASIKHPKTFHLPALKKFPQDTDVETQEVRKGKIEIYEQRPVFSKRQKETALVELENILPQEKSHPPLPPKPDHLHRKVEVETPVRSASVTEEKSQVDLSTLESKQPVDGQKDESPVSPEPYISATVKHPQVFHMPPVWSPDSVKAEPTRQGMVTEDEQFPVFSKVQKELVWSELENIIPKRKVPPKVPPKPRSRNKQKVEEPVYESTQVDKVECSVDLSCLDKEKPSKDMPSDLELAPETVSHESEEEELQEDERPAEDGVILMQAGISVYRAEPEEIFPAPGGAPTLRRAESLLISDTGDMSYIQRDDEPTTPDETPRAGEGHLQHSPVVRSRSTEMVTMSARLSLHRLESGERFTETVVSVHEREFEDEDLHTASSESEELPPVVVSTQEDHGRALNGSAGSEKDDDIINAEDTSCHLSDPFPEAPESFPGASVPVGAFYSDHFESPEISSADEFMTEADITISKMAAAINSHPLKSISSSPSSSSDESSGSSDSEDSSDSAEEHTYVVTESGDDGLERNYDSEGREAVLRSTTLPQVIEEGEEYEFQESSSDEPKHDEEGEEEEVTEETEEKQIEEEKTGPAHDENEDDNSSDGDDHDDDDKEHEIQEERDEHEIPCDQEVETSLETAHKQPELPETKIPGIIPAEVERYPRYVYYDQPLQDNKPPVLEKYETRIHGDPQQPSPGTYPPDVLNSVQPDAAQDIVTSEEPPTHVPEDVSDEGDREYDEATMDFSSESSDDAPEWPSPPPSSGARIFVLTANVQHPMKVVPNRDDLIDHVQHQTSDPQPDDLQSDEPRDSEMNRREPDQDEGEETKGIFDGNDRKEADDEDQRRYEDEYESDKYFRPIAEVAPTALKTTVEEQARPIPQYSNAERYGIPEISNIESVSEVPEDAIPPTEQGNKTQGVRTLTVTYTVIHTKPTSDHTEISSSEKPRQDEAEDTGTIMDSSDVTSSPGEEMYLNEGIKCPDNKQTTVDEHGVVDSKHNTEQYPSASPGKRPSSSGNAEPENDGKPNERSSTEDTEIDEELDYERIQEYQQGLYSKNIQPTTAKVVESGAPLGNSRIEQWNEESISTYATDLDKYESMYKTPSNEMGTTKPDRFTHGISEHGDESTTTGKMQPAHETVSDPNDIHKSKVIPVNEVGPYNYNSHPEHLTEEQAQDRETSVRKIQLRPEVSLFTISSREQKSPERKPTSPEAAAAAAAETEETGPYRFTSWYEEPSDDMPAMAIALVKSDIRLPSDQLPDRNTTKPDPKPKPKKVPVIEKGDKTSPEKLGQGPYKYTSWYDEPREEKRDNDNDVFVISTVEPKQQSSPEKETPLSPDVEPGTYRYSAWYEEPVGEPSNDDYFVISGPTASEEKPNADSSSTPLSPATEPGTYKYSAWYEEPAEKPSNGDYFVVSAPIGSEEKSKPDSSVNRDSFEKQRKELYALGARFEDQQASTEESSETFTISRPYEETRLSGDSGRQSRSSANDLYYPRETDSHTNRHVPDPGHLTVGASVSGPSSRKSSQGSSRTSGSLADVSATSGEAMRRTWSDESDPEKANQEHFRSGRDSPTFAPAAAKRQPQLPPQPKPRKGRPSAPSSSDEEQPRQPRRPGREGKEQVTTLEVGESLSPRAEYALASSAWKAIPVDEPTRPHESVVWDSGDDKDRKRPGDRNRYSVSDQSRREIESMLDSLVAEDESRQDAFDSPFDQETGYEVQSSPRRGDEGVTSQLTNDGFRSMNVLPQTHTKRYDYVDSHLHSTSEPQINRGFDESAATRQYPDFPHPQSAQPSTVPETRHANKRHFESRHVAQDDVGNKPLSSRDEYKLAAASWENFSSASDEESFKRAKMETWDNDHDSRSKRTVYPAAMIGQQKFRPGRAPGSSDEAYAAPRSLRGNGTVVTADIHAPFEHQPIPGDPTLAFQVLSASASTAELAPPPPTDWGTPRKAHSTLGISQLPPRQPESQTVIPDAEADIPRRRNHPRGRGPHPDPKVQIRGSRPPERSSSPLTISSYSSTQSLPARILPRLPREDELEKLKKHLAAIGKQIEIKDAELRHIHTKNPSVRHHIPMRGPRGELVSPDGRILSTPEAPNKAELEKYKRFFDKLPEPHFRRLMHEMLEYKHMVRQKEEEIRRLNTQCIGLRKRLLRLAQQDR